MSVQESGFSNTVCLISLDTFKRCKNVSELLNLHWQASFYEHFRFIHFIIPFIFNIFMCKKFFLLRSKPISLLRLFSKWVGSLVHKILLFLSLQVSWSSSVLVTFVKWPMPVLIPLFSELKLSFFNSSLHERKNFSLIFSWVILLFCSFLTYSYFFSCTVWNNKKLIIYLHARNQFPKSYWWR